MATTKDLQCFSVKASADLSSNQYLIVKLTSDGEAAAVTATTDAVWGVLQNNPGSAETAEVAYGGITKIKAGAAVDESAYIVPDAAGFGIAVSIDDGTPDVYAIGRALTAASGSATLFDCVLSPVPIPLKE